MIILMRRFKGLISWDFVSGVAWMLSAAGFASIITYAMVLAIPLRSTDVGFFSIVPKFILIVSISLVSYLLFSYLFNVKESKPIIRKIVGTIYKPIRLQ